MMDSTNPLHEENKAPLRQLWSTGPLLDMADFSCCNGRKGREYLTWVSNYVSNNINKSFTLKNPAGAQIRIAGLDDTIYKEDADEVNGWGKFYLPETVNMQVFGVVEGVSCPCDQLVLMTCEDRKVYAYDDDQLHLVASSLKDLHDNGLKYPGKKTYYKGQAFKHMTDEDWARVRSGPVGRRLDEEHRELVTATKYRFLQILSKHNTGVVS
ncbi:hypothetical protein Q5P01_018061 [Channa striata]|uniref:US22 family protein n=1 Tax=Channa striata TaxID=64152 RepID=A0AA88M428_CHASR|nr:hypothetical protein Q5P01_018061 [Channa striata]